MGTVNFVGYLLGAIFAKRVSKRMGVSVFIKINLAVSVLSLALCAFNFGFIWLTAWRFLAGITGAFLMVMTPSAILKNIPAQYRGRVSGLVFTGMGLGIVISGLLFPAFAKLSIVIAWLGAALFALIAALIAWPAFSLQASSENAASTISAASAPIQYRRILLLLGLAYALFGIGVVPHSLFLVDYVHTTLGLNTVISGLFWSMFGVGSLIGPFCAGFIGDKAGTYKGLVGAYLLCCVAIALVLYNHIIILYILSSFLMGMLLPAIVALTSSRIIELAGMEPHPAFWGRMTVCYSVSQALGAYGMSYLLHKGISYTACFVIADIVFFLGFITVVFTRNSQNTQKLVN